MVTLIATPAPASVPMRGLSPVDVGVHSPIAAPVASDPSHKALAAPGSRLNPAAATAAAIASPLLTGPATLSVATDALVDEATSAAVLSVAKPTEEALEKARLDAIRLSMIKPKTSQSELSNGSYICAKKGIECMKEGKLEDAQRLFERGISLGQGDPNLVMKMRAHLSNIARARGDVVGARDHAEKQLACARDLDNPKAECVALRTLGAACLASGLAGDKDDGDADIPFAFRAGTESITNTPAQHIADALKHFVELAAKAEEAGLDVLAAHAWRDVMKVHKLLRNQLQALEAAEKHLTLIRGKATRPEIGRAVASVCRGHAAMRMQSVPFRACSLCTIRPVRTMLVYGEFIAPGISSLDV